MTDITIPPEAIEAVRDELRLSRLWADPATARAACLAMINAWPGFWIHPYTKAIILPITESSND